jgi:hypothetical protein
MIKHKSNDVRQSSESLGSKLSASAQESLKKLLLAERPNLLEIVDWNGLFEFLSVSLPDPVGIMEGQPKNKDVFHVI